MTQITQRPTHSRSSLPSAVSMTGISINILETNGSLVLAYSNGVTWLEGGGSGLTAAQTAAVQAFVSTDGNGVTVQIGVPRVAGDMSAVIQAAIDAIYFVSAYGGTVYLQDSAVYLAQNIILRPRVNLKGTGVNFTEVHTQQTGTNTFASVTGSIAGTVLTITAVGSGVLVPGLSIVTGGVTYTITAYGTGTGGIGTYNLNTSGTVGSTALTVGGAYSQTIKGTTLRLVDSASYPLLSNDITAGFVRQTSNVLNDANNNALLHRYAESTIEGITFDGNSVNQTIVASAVYFERAWSVAIKNCNIINSFGFGLELNDCNAFQIDNVWSHYAPWFFYDTSDTQVRSCTISGSLNWGTSLWLHGNNSWLCQFGNNLIYNSSLNSEAQWTNGSDSTNRRIRRTVESMAGVDGSTSSVFTITSHKLYDEMPVLFSSTGTLPTGMFADKVYWAHRIGGSTFSVSENRNLLRQGVYFKASGTYTGTMSCDKGPAANIALTGGAQQNQFTGGRAEQSYGDGVLLLGATYNNINLVLTQEGMGSTTARAGVRLRSGYIETQPNVNTLQGAHSNSIGGLINGTATVAAAGTSNQALGVVCDDVASQTNLNTYGAIAVAHSAANFSPAHIGAKRRLYQITNVPAVRTAVGSAADQSATAPVTFTIPGKAGGSLGKNGRLIISLRARCPFGATRAGQFQIFLGNQAMTGAISLSNLSYELISHSIYANNATNSIKVYPTTSINAASGVDVVAYSMAMTSDQTLEVRVLWPAAALANDTISIDDVSVELIESD